MKHVRVLVALAMLFSSLAIATSIGPAAACGSGDICYWGEDSYSGCKYDTSSTDSNLSNNYWFGNCSQWSINQGINSAKNYGSSCTIILYDLTSYNGGWHWMSRVGLGGYWKDANFGNNQWTYIDGMAGTPENDITS